MKYSNNKASMGGKVITGMLYMLFVTACISEFNANLPSANTDILVVEGNIISDTVVDFYFSKSIPLNKEYSSEDDDPIVQLTVVGSDGYRSPVAERQSKGIYKVTIGELSPDVEYWIEFNYSGDSYQSKPSKPLATPPFEEVSWAQPVKEGEVSLRVSSRGNKAEPYYFLWACEEIWETKAEFETDVFMTPGGSPYLDETRPFLYCWKYNTHNSILTGTTEGLIENRILNKPLLKHASYDERFRILYSVLFKQQTLSKDGYEYYLDKAKGNEGMGGLFTPQPSAVEGNITCITTPAKKVIGYVEVNGNVVEKRMFIDAQDITRPFRSSTCLPISKDSVNTYLRENNIRLIDYYNMGHRPVNYHRGPNEEIVTGDWAIDICVDCIVAGGSKNKPDYWPNDHK